MPVPVELEAPLPVETELLPLDALWLLEPPPALDVVDAAPPCPPAPVVAVAPPAPPVPVDALPPIPGSEPPVPSTT